MIINNLVKDNSSICCDSAKIIDGDIFVALRGEKFDGNDFIPEILTKAKAVITDRVDIKNKYANNAKVILVQNAKEALYFLMKNIYNKIPEHLIAVTGTNGKSSVVSYIRQILFHLNIKSASIGTLGIQKDDDANIYESLTTPDTLSLYKTLNDLAQQDYNFVAIEASSHGLSQNRLAGLRFSAAAFTSFSRDHLDYHSNMEEYLAEKLKLFFDYLANNNPLIILGSKLLNNHSIAQKLKNFQYFAIGRDIKILHNISTLQGQKISFEFMDQIYFFETKIIGNFQIENLLVAAFLVRHFGINLQDILNIIPNLEVARGRLQKVQLLDNSKFNIFVDYAHTPDALKTVLQELSTLKSLGKLYVLFGCGGDRDKGKRGVMGSVANLYADVVIVTDDNPRSENPSAIRKEIIQNFHHFIEIADRADAIKYAVSLLTNQDILLVAGKGHEDYQLINGEKKYFNDFKVIESCFQK